MVFVTVGLDGATGTGAAPVVVEIAKRSGALTIGVVTKPFGCEGAKRRRQAEEGIGWLREKVDTLVVIPDDRLLSFYQHATVEEAFRAAPADERIRSLRMDSLGSMSDTELHDVPAPHRHFALVVDASRDTTRPGRKGPGLVLRSRIR